MSIIRKIIAEIVTPSRRVNQISLVLMTIYAVWACWQMYLETRLEKMQHIQILLPDPAVQIFMDSYVPIFLTALSLIILKRVHIPLVLGFFVISPIVRECLRWLDEIPGMYQPSPSLTVEFAPILILLAYVAFSKRFRSLDAIAVAFSYAMIVFLYLMYHIGFISPMYHQANHDRMARLERVALLTPEQVRAEMSYLGAREVSSLTPDDIAYLNDMSDMNQTFTFPGESAERIMKAHPESTYSYDLVGRTFVDRRALFYDGRAQANGGKPHLWALPPDFEQTQLIIATGGVYLLMAIAAYFWTLMAVFICYIHGEKAARLQPFARRKYLKA